jgi:putative ABC transport system permease protein
MLRTITRDLQFAARQARRQPVFTIVVMLTFAIGIGANTAIYSVVRAALLRPLPYAEPARLAAIWPTRTISGAELVTMQRESKMFSSVAAFSPGWGIAMTGAGEPTQLDAARVSTNFFATLGIRPTLGRAFEATESDHGNWNVAILSHHLWTEHFGSDRSIIGRVVDMDGEPTRIVGIMPADFEAFQPGVDAWLPLQIDPSSPFYTGQTALAFGRLAPSATFASAAAELTGLAPRMRDAFSYPADYARGATVISLHESLVGNVRSSLLVLLGAVVLLVLIAMANVGNLMLVNAAGRRRELAIRRALGASRSRLISQLLSQSLALAICGGAIGLAFGALGLRALRSLLPSTIPMIAGAQIDVGVLVVCAIAVVTAGVLFGIAPASVAVHIDHAIPRERTRPRRTLVVAETALAVMLVIGASLMTKSLWMLSRVDLGFDPHDVTSFRIQPSSGQLRSAEVYFNEMTRRLAAIPGVTSVGASQHLPLSGFNWHGDLEIESAPIPASATHPSVVWRAIVGNYFETMRIPLVRGREFTATDTRDAPPVVIINATMASKRWPGRDPIGQRIKAGNATRREFATIIGIVGDVKSASPDAPAPEEIYRPNAQQALSSMHFVVRGNASAADIRRAVRSLDQVVPIAEFRSLEQIYLTATQGRRTIAMLLAAFALAGLVLGAVGIYGVIAYSVAQRTRELGIRHALGAAERRIAAMVVGESMRPAIVGIVLGVLGALVAARYLETLVFGVSIADPLIYATVAAVVAFVAAASAFVPARRAARVDPMVALRAE